MVVTSQNTERYQKIIECFDVVCNSTGMRRCLISEDSSFVQQDDGVI